MSRFPIRTLDDAPDAATDDLEAAKKNFGKIPNILGIMANAPMVLKSYMQFRGNMEASSLDAELLERLHLAVSEYNHCDYCLAAHTAAGAKAGLSHEDMLASRKAEADDRRIDAALKLAHKITRDRGNVDDKDIKLARAAGLGEQQIIEIVAVVALNIFTNYFNHVAETDVDFPAAPDLDKD